MPGIAAMSVSLPVAASPASAERTWYYAAADKQRLAATPSQLSELVRLGGVTGNTLVWAKIGSRPFLPALVGGYAQHPLGANKTKVWIQLCLTHGLLRHSCPPALPAS